MPIAPMIGGRHLHRHPDLRLQGEDRQTACDPTLQRR
jgi:hypothetical protein